MTTKPMLMFEPSDDAGGGASDEGSSFDPWAPKEDEAGGGTAVIEEKKVEETKPAPVTIDPSAFEAFGKSFGETFAKTQAANAQALPPTPEQLAEARKQLKFFDINDDFVKNFGNIETQKAALEQFRDGITQHIITVMNHLRGNDHAEFKKNFDERFTPLQSLVEERQSNERQTRFNGRFKQFAAPELAPAVSATISHLAQAKAFEGKTEAQSFKLVADALASQAKAYNPNFVLEDAGEFGSSSHSSRSGNSIPVSSPGSGASRSGQPASAGKSWALSHLK